MGKGLAEKERVAGIQTLLEDVCFVSGLKYGERSAQTKSPAGTCSDQPIPDTASRFFTVLAGVNPPLNGWGRMLFEISNFK